MRKIFHIYNRPAPDESEKDNGYANLSYQPDDDIPKDPSTFQPAKVTLVSKILKLKNEWTSSHNQFTGPEVRHNNTEENLLHHIGK